jgi:VIT1/CCC1 family predicted Fe2+/Mn2+ transporter
MGVAASGVDNKTVLVTGLAGLLAGALSMGAGEYVSVSSQRELLEASAPSPNVGSALAQLDVDENELELVYRARGMSPEEASAHAATVLRDPVSGAGAHASADGRLHDAIGTGMGAAVSSFLFFATGAIIPVLPFLFGLSGYTAIAVAAVLVGIALLTTGVIVGLLSGAPPLQRALRQLLIGYGAAAITYVLGLLVGGGVG